MQAKRVSVAVAAVAALCIPSYSYGAEVTKAALGGIEENANVVTDVSIPGSRTWYGTCATAQGTQQKTVTTTTGDFSFATGARVVVKFSNSNTHSSPTLKVDGTAATALYSRTTYPVSYFWNASEVVCFIYDGSRFVMENGGTATTTYYGRTKLYDGVDSSSTALAATANSVYSVNNSVLQKTALNEDGEWHAVRQLTAEEIAALNVPIVTEGILSFTESNGTYILYIDSMDCATLQRNGNTLVYLNGMSNLPFQPFEVLFRLDSSGAYVLGSQSDKPIASYAFVTNALANSMDSNSFHVNSYITEMSAYLLDMDGPASYNMSNGRLTWRFDGSSDVMSTRPEAGTYTITVTPVDPANTITGIGGDIHVSLFSWEESLLPKTAPIDLRFQQVSTNTWNLVATVVPASEAYSATNGYYAYIDNFKVYTYDKPGYVAYSCTNDAAGVVSRVDTIDIAGSTNDNSRLVANAESVRRYTREQILETMKSGEFWHYSPDGKMSPDPSRVIIDQEVMFMGKFTYLTAGGMVAISADAGVTHVSTTGSVFRIGMFGNKDIEISGNERQLHINSFTYDSANSRWAINVATNFMENPSIPPVIRTVTNMEYVYDGTLMWQTLELTGTKSGGEWVFYYPAGGDDDLVRFFSAWAIQGEKKVHIGPKLELGTGQIVIDGNVYAPIEIVIGNTTLEVLGRVKP